jgi:hypothetical protein
MKYPEREADHPPPFNSVCFLDGKLRHKDTIRAVGPKQPTTQRVPKAVFLRMKRLKR